MSIRYQADNDLNRLIVHGAQVSIVVIPQNAALRSVVETLVLIWVDDRSEDWQNAITISPF